MNPAPSFYHPPRFAGTMLLCLTCVIVSATASGAADTPVQPDPRKAADAAFNAGEWDQAVAGYRALVAADPADGQAWSRLGLSLAGKEDFTGAVGAFEQAEVQGFSALSQSLRAASAYVHLGNLDKSFFWLEKAVAGGLTSTILDNVPALDELKKDPRYEPLYQQADRNARPCLHDPVHRQLDFWVGEWTVTVNGRTAGTNRIEKTLNGCVVVENWAGAGGSMGNSFNHYDSASKSWKQVWVDAGGGEFYFEGKVEDGAMKLYGEQIKSDGRRVPSRMSLTPRPDGTVRQLIQQSADEGKSWSVWFDGLYSPADAESTDDP